METKSKHNREQKKHILITITIYTVYTMPTCEISTFKQRKLNLLIDSLMLKFSLSILFY